MPPHFDYLYESVGVAYYATQQTTKYDYIIVINTRTLLTYNL